MGSIADWSFQENGKPFSVRIEPRLRLNTNDAVADLAARGWGLSRLLSYQIAPYLADGRLQTVLGAFEPPALPIHVVHQEGRMVSAKVRTDSLTRKSRSTTTTQFSHWLHLSR